MMGSIAAERQQHSAGFGHTQRRFPERNAGYAVVPRFAHEFETVWRVRDNRVHAVGLHAGHHFETIAVD